MAAGGRDPAHHRHRSRAVQDRNDEPRLQHASLRLPRKDGDCDGVNRRVMRFGSVSASIKAPPIKTGETSDSLDERSRIERSAAPRSRTPVIKPYVDIFRGALKSKRTRSKIRSRAVLTNSSQVRLICCMSSYGEKRAPPDTKHSDIWPYADKDQRPRFTSRQRRVSEPDARLFGRRLAGFCPPPPFSRLGHDQGHTKAYFNALQMRARKRLTSSISFGRRCGCAGSGRRCSRPPRLKVSITFCNGWWAKNVTRSGY